VVDVDRSHTSILKRAPTALAANEPGLLSYYYYHHHHLRKLVSGRPTSEEMMMMMISPFGH
jgi:hypothetical protein